MAIGKSPQSMESCILYVSNKSSTNSGFKQLLSSYISPAPEKKENIGNNIDNYLIVSDYQYTKFLHIT